MTVICQTNQSNDPPLVLPIDIFCNICNENYIVSSEWYTINSECSGYSITKERDYQVFGILIYDGQTRYLVSDDNGIPGFFPSTLFSIRKQEIFFDWKICSYVIDTNTLLYIGYPKLCESYDNLINLINRDPAAISDYLSYKDFVNRYEW